MGFGGSLKLSIKLYSNNTVNTHTRLFRPYSPLHQPPLTLRLHTAQADKKKTLARSALLCCVAFNIFSFSLSAPVTNTVCCLHIYLGSDGRFAIASSRIQLSIRKRREKETKKITNKMGKEK